MAVSGTVKNPIGLAVAGWGAFARAAPGNARARSGSAVATSTRKRSGRWPRSSGPIFCDRLPRASETHGPSDQNRRSGIASGLTRGFKKVNPRSLRIRLLQTAVLAVTLVFTSLPVYSQAPDALIVDVYPAQDREDKAALYAVVQQLPPPPKEIDVPQEWRSGVPLRVMVTAAPSGVTTLERRRAGDAPCMRCTAQHFFIVPEDIPVGRYRELSASRHPPGPVTYLFVKGKEYALVNIRVQRTAEGLRLDNAELMRTGFMIPIFKERIRLRFEAPLAAGSLKDEVIKAALADTDLFMREYR